MRNVIADQFQATTGGPRNAWEERKTKEYKLPGANAEGLSLAYTTETSGRS
ncbi:hypothetical protein GWC95_19120 [Sediminibacterium roseum]|uniref:Uncharacterized protein n=1 Tax=Sediminibacterium roseum TaxID=1978412 RepID=A0ABW9ZYA5_9BACT|nr:hypothetical protein [Sediminibacterium roseum]NCI52044.1 hypothetical protein [Sediminibacterium roseum]